MPARPIHRFGSSDRLFRGAEAGGLEAIQPGDAALFGLSGHGLAAQAVRDASWFGTGEASGRLVDLGNAMGEAEAVAQAIVSRQARPVLIGGRVADAIGLYAGIDDPDAALVLVSARLDHDIQRFRPGPMMALGVHDFVSAKAVRAWLAAGGAIVPATGGEAFEDRLASALRKMMRVERAVLVLDVGVVDAGHACGATSFSVGGLTPLDVLTALNRVTSALRIVGLAIVELDPQRDPRGHSERLASEAVAVAAALGARRAAA